MTKATHYVQRDSIEIAGKFYKLGEAVDSDVHPAVIQVLTDQGIIADSQPVGGASVPSTVVAIDDMNRLELEEAATTGMNAKMAAMSDDDLRKLARDVQSDEDREAEEKAKADAEKAESDADADADATTDPDKPKRRRISTEG